MSTESKNSEPVLHSPYERIRHEHLSQFANHIEKSGNTGSEDALFCVVNSLPLSDSAHEAMCATAARLGYSSRQLCFIVLSNESHTLEPSELFTMLEAIDPLCVVLTDHESVKTASAGYNTPLTLEAREFLLGRSCCCFESFEDLLSTSEGKQKAWACLTTLLPLAVLRHNSRG